jgi:hypothetical protein
MGRLQRLLQERLVNLEDVLYFTFKKHVFTGHVTNGGIIWNCTWQKPGELAQEIFKHSVSLGQQPYVRTFESLTDWTETCIQECLDEYHTRYSSWKRVRHQLTDKPMEVLFKNLQMREIMPGNSSPKPTLLFEKLASQKAHIDVLSISQKSENGTKKNILENNCLKDHLQNSPMNKKTINRRYNLSYSIPTKANTLFFTDSMKSHHKNAYHG